MRMSHLIARKEDVLCTNCFKTEPVHCGNGTPMGTLIMAYETLARRHQRCNAFPKEALRKFKESK